MKKKKRGRLHLLSWNNWFWFLAFEHCTPQSLILRPKKTSDKNIFNIYNSKTGSKFFEVKGNELVMSAQTKSCNRQLYLLHLLCFSFDSVTSTLKGSVECIFGLLPPP